MDDCRLDNRGYGMRKMVAVLTLLAIIVSQVPVVSAGTTTKTEELIQDYNFTNNNYAYWNIEKGGPYGDTWQVNLGSGYAYFYHSNFNAQCSDTDPSYVLISQPVEIPNYELLNATVAIHFVYELNMRYVVGFMNSSGDFWIWKQVSWAPYTYPTTIYINATNILSNWTGKQVIFEFGAYIDYDTSNGDYNFKMNITSVSLTVIYDSSVSGSGGWYGGGSGWYGGGSWWGSGSTWWGGGGLWFGRGGNQTYIEFVAARVQRLIAIGAGILVSILWVKVGIDYYSRDPEKRMRLRDDTLIAIVGTLIIALAVLGAIWMVAGWAVGASEVIVI